MPEELDRFRFQDEGSAEGQEEDQQCQADGLPGSAGRVPAEARLEFHRHSVGSAVRRCPVLRAHHLTWHSEPARVGIGENAGWDSKLGREKSSAEVIPRQFEEDPIFAEIERSALETQRRPGPASLDDLNGKSAFVTFEAPSLGAQSCVLVLPVNLYR